MRKQHDLLDSMAWWIIARLERECTGMSVGVGGSFGVTDKIISRL